MWLTLNYEIQYVDYQPSVMVGLYAAVLYGSFFLNCLNLGKTNQLKNKNFINRFHDSKQ